MADRKTTTTESEIKSKIEVVQIDGLVRKMKFNHVPAKFGSGPEKLSWLQKDLLNHKRIIKKLSKPKETPFALSPPCGRSQEFQGWQ